VAAIVLGLDCLLLLVMLFLVPCLPCLAAGLLFACVYLFARSPAVINMYAGRRSILFFVWLVLFVANVFPLGLQHLGVWGLSGPRDAPVRLYFSPSCPTCRQALADTSSMQLETIVYIPVAETMNDVTVIARMEKLLATGGTPRLSVGEALQRAQTDTKDISISEFIAVGLRVLRNRGQSLSAGASRIPFFTMEGLPGTLSIAPEQKLPDIPAGGDTVPGHAPFGGGFLNSRPTFGPASFQGCSQENGAEPCN